MTRSTEHRDQPAHPAASPGSPDHGRRRFGEAALAGGAWLALGASPTARAGTCPTLLDRELPRLQDEKPQNLCQYTGKVVLVVNTASFCGFTPQYKALEALYARYRERGLVVLGFPSNDFGAQEPGSNKEIADFCENTFGVKFPMFAKTRVAGGSAADISPLFAALRERTGKAPRWNFHKYLIARDGVSVSSFDSDTAPDEPVFVKRVETLLGSQ